MRYRSVGTSGLRVSVVGLGGNNFGARLDLDGTRLVVEAAMEAGINVIDTADVYGNRGGSETLLGEVLRGRREEMVIATKFGGGMEGAYGPDWGARGSRRYIRRAIDGSLGRLQTDFVDLYQYHVPDRITPLEETLEALDELVKAGKVRYIGSSNLDAWHVAHAAWVARDRRLTAFISAQNQYSLLDREIEEELAPACLHYGVGILPYFPLARGLLTGKYHRDRPIPGGTRLQGRDDLLTDRTFDRLEAMEKFAADRGMTFLDIAIGGLAAQPAVSSVIAGAMTAEQVRANAAAGEWQPTAGDLEALDAVAPSPRRP